MEGDVPRLLRFQKEIEGGLGIAGFPAEERPFRPHLTLARIKSPRGLTGLERALEKGEEYAAGAVYRRRNRAHPERTDAPGGRLHETQMVSLCLGRVREVRP